MATMSLKTSSSSMRGVVNWMKTFRAGVTYIVAGIFIVIPLLSSKYSILSPLIYVMIWSIFGASWDILGGFTGQFSFGHVMFLGAAGYIYAHCIATFNLPWWIALFIAAGLMICLAFLIGIPLQRMSGPYFTLGTLAIGLAFLIIILFKDLEKPFMLFGVNLERGISGGAIGIQINEFTTISDNIVYLYYFSMICMVVSLVIIYGIGKSRMGTIFKSIRDDDMSAKASGINIVKYKVYAFMISGFFAGIAGCLYAERIGGAFMQGSFDYIISFYPLFMVMIGGITTTSGAILGAFIFQIYKIIIDAVLNIPAISVLAAQHEPWVLFLQNSQLFIFAIIIMIIMRFASDGLMNPLLNKLKKMWDLLAGK